MDIIDYKDIDDLILNLPENEIESLSNASDSRRKSIYYCRALGLIKRHYKYPAQFVLDEKGFLVIEDGGIKKYLDKIRKDKDLDTAIKELTHNNLRKEVAVSVFLVILGTVLGYAPVFLSEDKTIEVIESLSTSLQKSTNLNTSYQNEVQQMYLEIDSLKTELDSLNNNNNNN
ncbi:hypothetical protein [Algibacter sp. L1A34]|uniref:hypothetical protein n=1 Tax=Algibacter sp. L1A34 TaxID=2686365 RepID=UPI00131E6727|nr:hypothetical protein [Algibacter sp. L1A34]